LQKSYTPSVCLLPYINLLYFSIFI